MGMKFLKADLKLADHIASFELAQMILFYSGKNILIIYCFDFHLNIIKYSADFFLL
jgi:hypothetical protein